MSAKIIPIGSYQRVQDVRAPRTAREAWGKDVEVEKTGGLPRPLWQIIGIAAGLPVLVGILIYLAPLWTKVFTAWLP